MVSVCMRLGMPVRSARVNDNFNRLIKSGPGEFSGALLWPQLRPDCEQHGDGAAEQRQGKGIVIAAALGDLALHHHIV